MCWYLAVGLREACIVVLVEVHFDMLTPSILNTSDVYILDCFADVFVW